MRKFLGGAVLALGVGGLGLYANGHQAKDMEARIAADAMSVSQGSMHGIVAEVSGRDIHVSGIADSKVDRANMMAELNGIDGRRIVIDDLEILKTASPFEIGSVKTADGQTYRGVVSSEAIRAVFAEQIGAEAAGGLVLASGLPDDTWNDVAAKGLASLDGLESGEMVLSDRMLTVKGVAATPVEKAEAYMKIGAMPEGYSNDIHITSLLETAAPFELSSSKSVTEQTFAGYVPSEDARGELAHMMGDAADGLTHAWGAPDENWTGVAGKGLAALDGLLSGEMRLSDQMLTVTGVAATPVEKAAAEAMVMNLPDGYTADVNITSKLETIKPFVMRSTKTEDTQIYSGVVPSEEARINLSARMGSAADSLKLAYGAPDDAWSAVAGLGLNALDDLEQGEMILVDRKLSITGVAVSPDEKAKAMAAVSSLPEGYSADVSISTLDDGKPASYTILYHPVTGTSVDGKLTSDMSKKAIAQALGVKRVSGDPVIARTDKYGTGDVLKKQLAVMAGWLPELEGFSLTADGAASVVDIQVSPGVDVELIEAAIAEELGGTADLKISGLGELPDEGTVRENAAVGSEVYQGGFWLPVRDDIVVDVQNCTSESDRALKDTKINFLTSSARLDAKSVRAINGIAGVVLKCVKTGNLRVEIGGHTDTDGGWQLNMDLSAARAQSVVDALIERGVPASRITAKGYGPSEPIATNQTDEGKAANRRTTIRWSEVSE